MNNVKKVVFLLFILMLSLSLCACGEKITEEDIWAELTEADYWEYSINTDLGQVSDDFTFGDSHTVIYTFFWGDNLIAGYTGTAAVRLEDNTIDLIFTGKIDSNQNMSSLDEMKFDTLSYTFDEGEFKLFNSDGDELKKVVD